MTKRVSKERRKELKEGAYPDLWEAEALVYEIEELEAVVDGKQRQLRSAIRRDKGE